jgi:hypothetical protein
VQRIKRVKDLGGVADDEQDRFHDRPSFRGKVMKQERLGFFNGWKRTVRPKGPGLQIIRVP